MSVEMSSRARLIPSGYKQLRHCRAGHAYSAAPCSFCRSRPLPARRAPYPQVSTMTLTQLRYLVAIADAELNITFAATRVHATQPGLSKQLKQLEDELGFLLFVRKGRSLESVTPAGAE
jgi:hypothetical protein